MARGSKAKASPRNKVVKTTKSTRSRSVSTARESTGQHALTKSRADVYFRSQDKSSDKLQEKRKAVDKFRKKDEGRNSKRRRTEMTVLDEPTQTNQGDTVVEFVEDDHLMSLRVSDEQTKEFPSEEEDEESDEEIEQGSQNNNATLPSSLGAERSKSSNPVTIVMESCQPRPGTSGYLPREENSLPATHVTSFGSFEQTMNLMQNFMLQRGIIDKSMTEQEMQELFNNSMSGTNTTVKSGDAATASNN